MIDSEKNIARFEELAGKINREGMERLMDYVRSSDFYTAPASTKFHLSCAGGLLQHSLNVYDCLIAKKENPLWKDILESVPEESLIVMALFHDICKTRFYKRTSKNQKTHEREKVEAARASGARILRDEEGDFIWETVPLYIIEDDMPLGHGEKSCLILDKYIPLTKEETYAIRWHMGFTEERSQYSTLDKAMEKYPIVLALHEADLEASKLLEDKEGNKER